MSDVSRRAVVGDILSLKLEGNEIVFYSQQSEKVILEKGDVADITYRAAQGGKILSAVFGRTDYGKNLSQEPVFQLFPGAQLVLRHVIALQGLLIEVTSLTEE